jgi:hypothetical protein
VVVVVVVLAVWVVPVFMYGASIGRKVTIGGAKNTAQRARDGEAAVAVWRLSVGAHEKPGVSRRVGVC